MSELTFAEVEAWLKARREYYDKSGFNEDNGWWVLNGALVDLREHMRAGTPLCAPAQGPHHEEQNVRTPEPTGFIALVDVRDETPGRQR